jgi:hypothetical protein
MQGAHLCGNNVFCVLAAVKGRAMNYSKKKPGEKIQPATS